MDRKKNIQIDFEQLFNKQQYRRTQNQLIYYEHCKFKQTDTIKKNSDYSEGYIVFIHNFLRKSIVLKLLNKVKKKESLNIQAYIEKLQKYADIQQIENKSQDSSKLILCKHDNLLHLKFKDLQRVHAWIKLIDAYQHKQDKNKDKCEMVESQHLFSTKESQNGAEAKNPNNKQLIVKIKQQQKQLQNKRQLDLNYKAKILQLQLQLQKEKAINYKLQKRYIEQQENRNNKQKELQETIAALTQRLSAKERQLNLITLNKSNQLKLIQKQQEKTKLINQQYLQVKAEKDKKDIEIKQLTKKAESHKQQIQYLITFHLFHGQILDEDSHHHKQFVKNSIEQYTNKSIYASQLVYRFDGINKANFHNYIDGKRNIVLIAVTSSRNYLAGFSQSGFTKSNDASDGGLIMSLTNKKIFPCRPGYKSVSYDQYYICFGNAQIRIQSQKAMIYSNFGMSIGYYKSNGCKVDVLFGEDNRQVDLDHYQLYQVSFH